MKVLIRQIKTSRELELKPKSQLALTYLIDATIHKGVIESPVNELFKNIDVPYLNDFRIVLNKFYDEWKYKEINYCLNHGDFTSMFKPR